jgi:hypothetical protein
VSTADPAPKGNPNLVTALAGGGAMLAFLLIPALANRAPAPRAAPAPVREEFQAQGASPAPLTPADPLQSDPGSGTEDDYFLAVDWEARRGRFPFSQRDRLASAEELKEFTERRQRLVDTGALNDDDEASDDRLIYTTLFAANRTRADHMVEQFRALAARENLDAFGLACEVVRCIQKIPYAIPEEVAKDHVLGIFTPNEVAFYNEGDCDTKTLMAAVILTRLGFRCVLFGSNYYGHCMLGIETSGAGADYTDLDGHRYQWVEMTDYGSPIGVRPEDCHDPSKWVVTPLE